MHEYAPTIPSERPPHAPPTRARQRLPSASSIPTAQVGPAARPATAAADVIRHSRSSRDHGPVPHKSFTPSPASTHRDSAPTPPPAEHAHRRRSAADRRIVAVDGVVVDRRRGMKALGRLTVDDRNDRLDLRALVRPGRATYCTRRGTAHPSRRVVDACTHSPTPSHAARMADQAPPIGGA